MSLVAYVAEDGLVGHQWEERHLIMGRLYAPVQGIACVSKVVVVGGLGINGAGGYGGLSG